MKEYKLFAFIIAFAIVLRFSLFVAESSYIYYATLFIGAIFIIARKLFTFTWEINLKTLVFLFICLLSIVFNDIDPFFSPWERFAGFCMLLIVVGPFDCSSYSVNLKKQAMNYLQYMMLVFVVLSFIAFFLRVPFAFLRGSFNGMAIHPMTLCPIAAMSSLFCLSYFFDYQDKHKNKSYTYLVLLIVSLIVLLLSASRGAIGALLFAFGVYSYIKFRKKNIKLIKYIFVFTIFLTIIIFYNPGGVLDNIYKKIELRGSDDISSGRDKMWQDRIVDFKSSPIIGVGFSTMKEISNSKIDFFENTQESGNGWLMLLSSTGILGLVSYLILLLYPLFLVWKYYPEYSLNAGIAAFFIVHTIIEGYTLAFGSPLCALMWLNIGVLNTIHKGRSESLV